MRPTFSIILFTVLSGIGYGLWFLIGLGLAVYWPVCGPRTPADGSSITLALCGYPGVAQFGLVTGFVLVSAGLLSSVGHLGQPRRAWRALSQWRSSWLSREGVASIATYAPVAALIVMHVWTAFDATKFSLSILEWMHPLGAALAVGSFATVFCTGQIYASLKPIRAWHNRYTVTGYLLLGLYGGALLFWAMATLPWAGFGRERSAFLAALIALAALCAVLKILYWRYIDRLPSPAAGRATGLDAQGSVRSFEQPHTEENYLTREMGFVLARKHASKLRAITLLCAFVVPALLAAMALLVPATRAVAWPTLVFGLAGIFVERWLFFAEARHAVSGYYGR